MKKIYRALVIADSMAMPRLEVPYDKTWVAIVINKFSEIEFIDKCRRASTSERLVSDGAGAGDEIRSSDLLEYYNPDLIITQIGITDCAPRLIQTGGFFSYLFHIAPGSFIKVVINLLKKYRGRKRKYSKVSPEKFRVNWEQYFSRCKNAQVSVICIKIGKPTKLYSKKSPEITEAICLYNSILEDLSREYENVQLLDPFDSEEIEKVAIDEFHVGVEGHIIIAKRIEKQIEQLIKKIPEVHFSL